ncbi:hypothetical protein Tco_1207411 [Tanacetum coccineum]
MRRSKGDQHVKLRGKPKEIVRRNKAENKQRNCIPYGTPGSHDRIPNYARRSDQGLQGSKSLHIEEAHQRLLDLRVTMGEPRRSKIVLMEFAIMKCHFAYNVMLGRTRMKSLGAVGSMIHSMMKFPTATGVATLTTRKEALRECKQIKEA